MYLLSKQTYKMSDSEPLPLPEPNEGSGEHITAGAAAMELWMNQQDQGQPTDPFDGYNQDAKHDPSKSAVENFNDAYDGNPPQSVLEFGTFLDITQELLDRLERGEITPDEFSLLHDQAAKALDGPKNPPAEHIDPSLN